MAQKRGQRLLSPEPIAAIHEEYVRLAILGGHFSFINTTVYIFLIDDHHAEKVRAAFFPFNQYMDHAIDDIKKALSLAREFYVNEKWELDPVPTKFEDPALVLLDPEFQAGLIDYASRAVSKFSAASQLIREKASPLLPDLADMLCAYVDEYATRARVMEEREKSWIPSLAQDMIWGRSDISTWNVSEVTALPEDIRSRAALLQKLPALLDTLSNHFLRLSEIKQKDISEMGYSSLDDLRTLLADRTTCFNMLLEIGIMLSESSKAFGKVKFAYPPKASA